jgi:molybdate transport repressor ModE-like protein
MHRSIAAAGAMDMSDRRAWLPVDEMNGLFAQPVIAKWQGGHSKSRACLTQFGEKLIQRHDVPVERSNDVNRDLLQDNRTQCAPAVEGTRVIPTPSIWLAVRFPSRVENGPPELRQPPDPKNLHHLGAR